MLRGRPRSPVENTLQSPRATRVAKLPPHTSATPFLASLRHPTLYQPHFGTNGSEQTGLPSWKVAWSYVENFSSYSRSKLIKVDQLFHGVFKRSSNRNTYRNEAFKDIFSCRGKSLWIWAIWRLKSEELPSPAQVKTWPEKDPPQRRFSEKGSLTCLLVSVWLKHHQKDNFLGYNF